MKKILGFLTVFLAVHVCAQTETYDIVSFNAPPSWKRDTSDGSISFTASKGNVFCVAGLYRSRAIKSADESEFLTEWNELVNIPYGIHITPLVKRSQQEGWVVFSGSTDVSTKQSGTFTIKLVSFAEGGKIISASINSNGDLFSNESAAFLSSIASLNRNNVPDKENANRPAVAANAPKAGEVHETNAAEPGISGVWVGFESGNYIFGITSYDYINNRNNYGSTYSSKALAMKWRVFWTDGKYYDGMPHQGLIDFNRADRSNDYAGYYTTEQNVVTARLDHYSSAVRTFVFYPPCKLKYLDKYEYVKCQPVDGLKLNGTYVSADMASISYYISLNKPNPSISFTTDGLFTDDNYIGEYSRDTQLGPGAGIYEIKNFTLILKYTDGRTIQRSFTPFLNETPSGCKVFYIGSRDIKLKP